MSIVEVSVQRGWEEVQAAVVVVMESFNLVISIIIFGLCHRLGSLEMRFIIVPEWTW